MLGRATKVLAAFLWLAVSCSSGQRSPGSTARVEEVREGLLKSDRGWLFRTGDFTVAPGEERYLCYAVTLTEDLAVSRFSSVGNPAVHHFLLAQTLSPEPDGFSECGEVLYRSTWLTMYGAVARASEVKVPAGAAKLLPTGSQVLLQAHIVNTTDSPIKTSVEVRLDASVIPNPEPVGITIFGNANVHLPPKQETTVESTCVLREDTRVYAFLPHMHTLGRRLELDIGDDEAALAPAYTRDPFDFDEQHFDPFERTLAAGTVARLKCTFENPTDEAVKFGETSRDEMCFAVAFRVGGVDFDLCGSGQLPADAGVPRAPDSGVCGEVESPGGIGRLCTPGGGECPAELFCSADFLGTPTGVCFEIGCASSVTCGEGSTCCTLPVVGSIGNICLPEACRPDSCIPVEMR